jgi:hypothetical protein
MHNVEKRKSLRQMWPVITLTVEYSIQLVLQKTNILIHIN